MVRPLSTCLALLLLVSAGWAHGGAPGSPRTNLAPILLGHATQLADQPRPDSTSLFLHPYHVVPVRQAQCLAAQHADVANLLDQERQALAEKMPQCCLFHARREQNELQQIVLLYTALEVRNSTAGLALEGFHGLAGAEARAELLQAGLGEIERALGKTLEQLEQGLKPPIELDTLRRQEHDARHDEAENRIAIDKLNHQLIPALGLDESCKPGRIWPDLELGAVPEPCLDEEKAIAVGLSSRPKLVMLRQVIPRVNRHTVESARLVLGNVNALLGASARQPSVPVVLLTRVVVAGREVEAAETLKAQLKQYLRDQEQAVAAEIRQALSEIHTRRGMVQLARERLRRVQERLVELRQLQAQGLAGYPEQLAGQAEALKARGELIKELLLWKTAQVRLRQAQGLLVRECDHAGPP